MWATDYLSTDRMQRGYCHGLLALVMAAVWAGDVAAQADATYIKASNPGVDDQFGGSGGLLGVSVALSGDGTTLRPESTAINRTIPGAMRELPMSSDVRRTVPGSRRPI